MMIAPTRPIPVTTRRVPVPAIPMSLRPRPNLRSQTSARPTTKPRPLPRRLRSRLRLAPTVLRTCSLVT